MLSVYHTYILEYRIVEKHMDNSVYYSCFEGSIESADCGGTLAAIDHLSGLKSGSYWNHSRTTSGGGSRSSYVSNGDNVCPRTR
jgi:hypothetical protein